MGKGKHEKMDMAPSPKGRAVALSSRTKPKRKARATTFINTPEEKTEKTYPPKRKELRGVFRDLQRQKLIGAYMCHYDSGKKGKKGKGKPKKTTKWTEPAHIEITWNPLGEGKEIEDVITDGHNALVLRQQKVPWWCFTLGDDGKIDKVNENAYDEEFGLWHQETNTGLSQVLRPPASFFNEDGTAKSNPYAGLEHDNSNPTLLGEDGISYEMTGLLNTLCNLDRLEVVCCSEQEPLERLVKPASFFPDQEALGEALVKFYSKLDAGDGSSIDDPYDPDMLWERR